MSEVADLARANVLDNLPAGAVQCFATLGTEGKFPANQERDLHRWLQCLFGVSLRPYSGPNGGECVLSSHGNICCFWDGGILWMINVVSFSPQRNQ